MKKYTLLFFTVMLLTVAPFWIGNATTTINTHYVVKNKKINASLLETRLKHNAELINLSESFKMKTDLTDSILSTREAQIDSFRYLLGYLESGNRYVIDNGSHIGAYQFGDAALRNVGLGHITRAKYLKNPNVFPDSLQDWAVIQLALENQKLMYSKGIDLNKYVGKRIHGIKVTKGGILAAAHLIGWYDCSNYLSTWGRVNSADANGTHASDYMKKFEDKDIVAFDIEKEFYYDLCRIWSKQNLPKYTLDKIY